MRPTTFAICLIMAGWISSAATAQRPSEPATEPAHNVFLLTGCLERGAAPVAFKLSRASVIGQAPSPANAAAASSKNKVDDVYELQATVGVAEEGLSREKLEAEVGSRVEVTIRPIESALPTSPRGAAEKNAGDKPAEFPRQLPQRYTVIKLSRIAGSCA